MTERSDTERVLAVSLEDLGLWAAAGALVLGVCVSGALALSQIDMRPEPHGMPDAPIFLEFAEAPVSPSQEELELPSGELSTQSKPVPDDATEMDQGTLEKPIPEPPADAQTVSEKPVEPTPEPVPAQVQPETSPAPVSEPPPVTEPAVDLPEDVVSLQASSKAEPAIIDEIVEPPAGPTDENAVPMPASLPAAVARLREATPATVFTQPRPVPPPSAASQAAAPPPAPTAAPQAAAPQFEAGSRPEASDVRNWQSRVMRHLAQRRQYPPGASQRREQGVATVRFSIGTGGEVQSVRLVQSSGYAQLDEAAVALVHRSSPLPAPPAGLPRSMLTLTAPIEYRIR